MLKNFDYKNSVILAFYLSSGEIEGKDTNCRVDIAGAVSGG